MHAKKKKRAEPSEKKRRGGITEKPLVITEPGETKKRATNCREQRTQESKREPRNQKRKAELEEKTDANQPNREKNRGSTQGDEEKMKTGN